MSTSRVHRVLAVADWRADPRVVADTLLAETLGEPSVFGLLVPARLPGLTWIGDPNASRPCAERHLAELERLARARGLAVEIATVGDPERAAAITAALEDWEADRVLLFDSRPARIARRVAKRLRRPVDPVAIAPEVRRRPRGSLKGLAALWRPHCEIS